MSNVSTIEQSTQTLQYLQQLQGKAAKLETQISTGQQSTSFAGLAPQASQLVNLTATQSQQQGYINTIATVNTRLSTMSLAMTNVAQIATTFQKTISTNAFNTSGASIQQTAQQLLTELGSYLNTQDGSRYVFSGNATGTASYNPASLPNPGDLVTNVAADYYGGDNGIASASVDKSVNVKYGVTGNNPAFEQIVRVLNYYANNATPLSQANPTDVANVQTAQQMLATAAQQVQTLVANTGEQQADLAQLSTAHQSAQTLASSAINGIQNVDSATAITQLNTLQTQLQASYQTINLLQGLSLVNYLK